MAHENMGSYAPGSNLKENWDGSIREVVFEKQDNSQNYAAHLTLDADDGEEVEVFAGLGGDWASYDGGVSVEHPKGTNRKFQNGTFWSKLLVRMFDCVVDAEGAENEMVRRDRACNGQAAQQGGAFVGLRFHWDVEKVKERRPVDVETTNSDGTVEKKREWQEVEVERMLPQKYLGVKGTEEENGESTPAPAPAASTSSTPAQPSAQPAASNGSTVHPAIANLPAADQIKLKTIAKTKDFGGFVDGVMELTLSDGRGTLEVPEIIQALADEGFYLALKG